jgi:TonB-linked SusC/RagA family outer membrane protein
LRGSWGQVGNQEIDNYAAIATIDPVARYILGSGQVLSPGATFLGLGNQDLKWETTTQTDIGVDVSLFDNRLNLTADYYIKNTTDVLLQLPIVTSSGIRRNNGPFRNAGEIRNSGFEFTVNFQNTLGELTYNIGGNFSTINNEVVSLGGGEPIIAQLSSDPNFANTITQEGGEIGAFYGYIMDGVFASEAEVDAHAEQTGSEAGDVRFLDLNNDDVINSEDRTVIGSPFPNLFYGFNADFNYAGFDLSFFFQGIQGGDIYNLLWAGINDGEGDNNATAEMLNRWTPQNTNTNVPRAIAGDPGDNDRPSTRFLEDGSYLRLRNLQLGYNFGRTLLEGIGMQNLRVYLSGQNLFTFTDYRSFNPDVGILSTADRSTLTKGIDFGTYPIPRIISLGLQFEL